MKGRFINSSPVNKSDKTFDGKVFFISSMFFLVVLVNPRDFPVNNIPLIYPAFLLFAILIGPHNLLKGFRRTKFLCIILSSYWFYFIMLHLVKEHTIGLGSLAYFLEPLLIFGAVGAVTIRPGGTKTALWALVSMITFSTACGIWIYFIGEPVASWRSLLQGSIGGNILQGEFIREADLRLDAAKVFNINSGLSYYIFSFSYQLAVAILTVWATLLSTRHIFNIKNILLWCASIILFIGVVSNTERAIVLSVAAGLISFFLIKGRRILKARFVITFILCVVIAMVLIGYTSKIYTGPTIQKRITQTEGIYVRGFIMPTAAISSIFFEPLGAGGLSDYYKRVAYRVNWVTIIGPAGSHNHFANIIMYTGIVGVFLILALFRGLWRKIKYIRLSALDDDTAILGAVCITVLVHSLTHNLGFFKIEPATAIVFGLLWGATVVTKNDGLHNNIRRQQ